MASTKEFKNRLKSISSIKKITKAMKMVAASKLRMAQKSCENIRPYNEAVSPFINVNDSQYQNRLIVPITSDRGLCGGVNSSVVKTSTRMVRQDLEENANITIIAAGEKGKDALIRQSGSYITRIVSDLSKKPVNFLTASLLADQILNQDFDKCTIIYNEFKSVLVQNVTNLIIPSYENMKNQDQWNQFEFEGDSNSIIYNFYEFTLSTSILKALLENATSEQGARMTAMDNASKNAGEMIDKLNLKYNKARQASITSELIDIISAAGAVA